MKKLQDMPTVIRGIAKIAKVHRMPSEDGCGYVTDPGCLEAFFTHPLLYLLVSKRGVGRISLYGALNLKVSRLTSEI